MNSLESKKILIVTKFFYPEITPRAFRAFELAKEFARQGHNVKVLTTNKNYDYKALEVKYGFKIEDTVANEPNELVGGGLIRLIRFGLKHFFLFPFIYLSKYFKKALKKETGYDILISIAYPYTVHFGVALATDKNKELAKVWIADCGDPFTGGQETRFESPFYYKWIEKWFCKKPHFITIPIKEAKSAYPSICQHKLKVIPQGFDFSTIKPNFKPGENKVITFAYAGTLSAGSRDPRSLIDYLQSLNKDFKFILYTRNKDFLEVYKKQLGDKLELRDYVPRDILLRDLGKMDFLVNLENKTSIHSPSKLIDYALLERPILSVKPFDLDTEIVDEFMTANYKNSLIVENIENYNITNVANNFLALYNQDM
ncbi:glycosyltransferase [Winogradskyella sp. UBA3174]|uniref:glycosyltransferase n=1 Tax=Winogradskyella sp. UBA3174 TaxID=1947785 RepID=UPI0025D13DFE|nr:glycosyltransferase [Winogradskyella sp. UBA3174]|tara:strand:+ start:45925 stop:47034 length:1110 start_codon:yes stop_codon:yes gene_type:complete